MSARRWTAAALPTALLAGVLLPVLATPVLAADDPVTGYWTRTNVGLPVQPLDPTPEGGTWISGDPTGPVAVSAIRAGADDGNVVAGFRLKVDDVVGSPSVLVCPTTERWAPERAGRLEAAPMADCSAPLIANVVEGVLLVDLPVLVQGDVVDLLLTPSPGSAPFSLTLQKATAESIVQAPDPAASSTVAAPAPPPAPLAAGPPPGVGGGFSSGTPAFPDFGAPAAAVGPALAAPALPAPPAAAAAAPAPLAAPAPAAPVTLARQPAAVPADRTASLLATGLLAMLAAVALRLAVQPAAAPRHLGGGARLSRGAAAAPAAEGAPAAPVAETPRGVGRFRAPRLHPPVRI